MKHAAVVPGRQASHTGSRAGAQSPERRPGSAEPRGPTLQRGQWEKSGRRKYPDPGSGMCERFPNTSERIRGTLEMLF